jgi:hypothetical protein
LLGNEVSEFRGFRASKNKNFEVSRDQSFKILRYFIVSNLLGFSLKVIGLLGTK